MNDIERFALNVEYTTGKKRGRHPVFSSSQFYPYAAERRLQNSLRNELERYMAEAFGAATAGENFVTDTLEDLSRLPDEISEDMKNEIAYASDAIARKVSSSIAEMTEMTIGKPYYPPAAKQEILTSWEANFQTLCKSAKSDMKKEMSMIVQQAKNEGWNGKQLEREIRNRLPEKYAGRAKNIARTETGKLNTAITLSTYKEIGIQYYVWMATMDERTRTDHAMMNGLICSATDPTVWYEENPDDPMHPIEHKRDDTMVHLHPGDDFQCRCTMVMWDPVVDGKYEVKERQPEEEPEEGQQGAGKASASQELEKATEALAEKEKALEKAENERKTVENELAQEKSARKAAEKSAAEAEKRAEKAEKNAGNLEKTRKTESERTISLAEKELKEAGRYRGLTNDPGLNKAIAETEYAINESKKGGLISSIFEKVSALKEKIFGLETEEEMMEGLGVKRFATKKTPLQVVDGANPSNNKRNCFATGAAFEARCRGWDLKVKPYDESMIVLANEPQRLFKGAKKVKFTSLDSLKNALEKYEEGARFEINADFFVRGRVASHTFNAFIEDGKIRFVCSQEKEKDASVFFRKYKLIEEENFFFRTDSLQFNFKNLEKVIQ